MGKLARESILVTIFIAIGILIGAVTNIFFFPLIASKSELGEFKLFLYWSGIFSMLASLGVQGAVIRKYHSFKDEDRLGELNFMMLFIPLAGLLIICLIIAPFANSFIDSISRQGFTISNAQALMVLALFTFLHTYIRAYSGTVILLKRNAWLFFNTDVLARITLVICFTLFAVFDLGMFPLLIMISSSFLLQLSLIFLNGREIIWGHRMKVPSWSEIMKSTKMGAYLMLDSAATMIINKLDIIMIGYLAIDSNKNTQEFDIANNLSIFIFMPWRTLTNTSIPFIAEAFKAQDVPRIESIYKKTSLHLLIIGSLIFTFIYSNIDSIIHVIPDDYTSIKYTVLFLGIAKIIDMTFSVNNNILVLSPYYRYNLIFSVFLIGLTILLNYLLIPPLGITGTAIGTLVVILIFNLLKNNLLFKKYNIHPFHQNTLQVLLFMGIIFGISMLIPAFTSSAFVNIAIKGSITGILAYIYLVWKKPSEEIEQLRVKTLKRIPGLKKTV